jgi:hypothetical protein
LLIEGEAEEAFPQSLLFDENVEIDKDGCIVKSVKKLEMLAADIRPNDLKGHNRQAYGESEHKDKILLSKAIKLLKTEQFR